MWKELDLATILLTLVFLPGCLSEIDSESEVEPGIVVSEKDYADDLYLLPYGDAHDNISTAYTRRERMRIFQIPNII